MYTYVVQHHVEFLMKEEFYYFYYSMEDLVKFYYKTLIRQKTKSACQIAYPQSPYSLDKVKYIFIWLFSVRSDLVITNSRVFLFRHV